MKRSVWFVSCIFALTSAIAHADSGHCPSLPNEAALQWRELLGQGYLACKAIATDGHEVLGLMLSEQSPDLKFSAKQRAERGTIDHTSVQWYQPNLGTQWAEAAKLRRVTVVKFSRHRYAQIWINAQSPEELTATENLVTSLSVEDAIPGQSKQ